MTPRPTLAGIQERLLEALRLPMLRYGFVLGLAVVGVLAIPWFEGTPADPKRSPPAAAPEARAPAPAPVPAPLEPSEPEIRAESASPLPEIRALGPEPVGATLSPAPTLYWFLSEASSVPVEITLTSEQAAGPLLELRIEPPVGAGLHSLRLEQRGVVLEIGATHRWFVALVPDAADRHADLVSGAAVRRDAASDTLSEELAAADPAQRADLLAAAGYWYDAFDTLTRRIQEEPADELLREQRAALLEQVGLTGVAALVSAPAAP